MPVENNREVYEQIKNLLNIVDFISERVKLKRSGRGYIGLCPFHSEKTASFYVYPSTQSYYCFGCHEAGDIFTFLMRIENINFSEALEMLANRAGIELPKYERNTGERNYYEIMELASEFYADNLRSESGIVARAYIERRNLSESDVLKFSLGYSPLSWHSLINYLRRFKISDSQMLELGLAVQGEGGIHDRFRGRLIFPIKNISGRIIGFGGRAIDADGAKYINSQESVIFSKRRNLYLLNEAKNAIQAKKRSILVEGYMDAIRLHKFGFSESVASLGTSLTSEQAEILSRFADSCYICYDSDKAGQKATLKSMFTLQKYGLNVYVINIPGSKDPDEFLISNGAEEFEQAIKSAEPLLKYYINALKPLILEKLTRKKAIKELFMNLSGLDLCDVLEYKMYISEVTGIPPSKIEEYFVSGSKRKIPKSPVEFSNSVNFENPCEAALCSLMFKNSDCVMSVEEITKFFKDSTAKSVALAILTESCANLEYLWTSLGDDETMALLARGDEFCERMKGLNISEKWHNTRKMLEKRYITDRINELTAKMRKSQATSEELLEIAKLKGEMRG